MKRKIFTLLCVSAAIIGCSKDEDPILPDGTSMGITIDAAIQTRATELSFEDNDQIGLTIITDSDEATFYENSPLTYASNSFNSELTWYADLLETSTLYAYYPYVAGSNPTSFTVQADQSTTSGYAASDLMIAAKNDVVPTDESVMMTFNHSLGSIVISLDNQSSKTVSAIEICGTLPTATIDITAGTVVVNESSSATDIKASLNDDGSYTAIIVPQTATVTFNVTFDDDSVVSFDEGAVSFVGGGEYSTTITLTSSNTIPFEEYDGYFIYDGVTYNTITLDNGTTWMTSNLAYLPEGYTPSSDASVWSGVWYPYKLDYDQMVIDGTVALSPSIDYVVSVTDQEGIESLGYLYDIKTALTGGTEITEENCYDFEGKQGICPQGWHIPTRAEYFDLVGLSNKNALGETGNQTNTEALFYDASYGSAPIPKVNEGGFNYTFSGYRFAAGFEGNSVSSTTPYYMRTMIQSSNSTVEEWYGELALTYYMTSTCYQPNLSTTTGAWYNTQFFAVMSTFVKATYPTGRLALAYISAHSGQAIRCVKDSE
ncbi:MAG: fimbrillin family protein [Rikenellaceae bacterium]